MKDQLIGYAQSCANPDHIDHGLTKRAVWTAQVQPRCITRCNEHINGGSVTVVEKSLPSGSSGHTKKLALIFL